MTLTSHEKPAATSKSQSVMSLSFMVSLRSGGGAKSRGSGAWTRRRASCDSTCHLPVLSVPGFSLWLPCPSWLPKESQGWKFFKWGRGPYVCDEGEGCWLSLGKSREVQARGSEVYGIPGQGLGAPIRKCQATEYGQQECKVTQALPGKARGGNHKT